MLTEDTTPPFNCADGTQTTGPLTLTPLTTSHNEDALLVPGGTPGQLFDPCPDWKELDDSLSSGGLRDPFNPYDFYDPNGDGSISIGEVFTVAGLFGADVDDPNSGYEIWYDRGPKVGPGAWNMTAPDGVISNEDIFAIAAQAQHSC